LLVALLLAVLSALFLESARVAAQDAGVSAGAYVDVNGARLWYRLEGRGEPLLLIPGGPGNPHDRLVEPFSRLRDAVTLVYFDPFGRGRSDRARSPDAYSLTRDVEDIEGLRRALNLGPLNVLGHSYGGVVAQAYALKYPTSIRRLILSSTIHSAEMWQEGNNGHSNAEIRNQFPEVWEKLQTIRQAGRLSSDTEYQALIGTIPTRALLYLYDPSNVDAPIPEAMGQNPDVYFQIAGRDADVVLGGDLATFDFRPLLRSIDAPILVTAGRFDRIAPPRWSLQFRQYAPQARFVMFEHSGHFPYREEPEAFFAVLRDFLHK
jgi:proline iminopeptidase